MLVSAALLGVGIGLAFAALGNLIVQAVPSSQTGVASGMNTVMRTLGGALGGQLSATFIASNIAAGGLPTVTGFTESFLLATGFLALCFIAGLLVPKVLAPDGGGRRPRAKPRCPLPTPPSRRRLAPLAPVIDPDRQSPRDPGFVDLRATRIRSGSLGGEVANIGSAKCPIVCNEAARALDAPTMAARPERGSAREFAVNAAAPA